MLLARILLAVRLGGLLLHSRLNIAAIVAAIMLMLTTYGLTLVQMTIEESDEQFLKSQLVASVQFALLVNNCDQHQDIKSLRDALPIYITYDYACIKLIDIGLVKTRPGYPSIQRLTVAEYAPGLERILPAIEEFRWLLDPSYSATGVGTSLGSGPNGANSPQLADGEFIPAAIGQKLQLLVGIRRNKTAYLVEYPKLTKERQGVTIRSIGTFRSGNPEFDSYLIVPYATFSQITFESPIEQIHILLIRLTELNSYTQLRDLSKLLQASFLVPYDIVTNDAWRKVVAQLNRLRDLGRFTSVLFAAFLLSILAYIINARRRLISLYRIYGVPRWVISGTVGASSAILVGIANIASLSFAIAKKSLDAPEAALIEHLAQQLPAFVEILVPTVSLAFLLGLLLAIASLCRSLPRELLDVRAAN